jgi:hypothetical protein
MYLGADACSHHVCIRSSAAMQHTPAQMHHLLIIINNVTIMGVALGVAHAQHTPDAYCAVISQYSTAQAVLFTESF